MAMLTRLWTREEYHRAAEAEVFGPEERLELVDGEVIRKVSPQNIPHRKSIRRFEEVLEDTFGQGYVVWTQFPLPLSTDAEPEPDVMVLLGPESRYDNREPGPTDVALVVEISDSTVPFDTGRKAAIYARAGIADYWVLNLPQRRLEVYRDPGPVGGEETGYRTLQICPPGMETVPLAVPGRPVRVDDVLP